MKTRLTNKNNSLPGDTLKKLINHIRKVDKISIKDSDEKYLSLMGYFHGYQACRFVRTDSPHNSLNIKRFSQIRNIYNVNDQLKLLFYPIIMQLETALKSRIIDILASNHHCYLHDIFANCLNGYKDIIPHNSKLRRKRRDRIKNKYRIEGKLYNAMSRNIGNDTINYYVKRNQEVPIWAIFEFITLGTFGYFVDLLNLDIRKKLEESIGIIDNQDLKMMDNYSHDDIYKKYTFICTHLFLLNDLRDAVAHNKIIFDCRFRSANSSEAVKYQLRRKFHMKQPVTFNSIVDYFTLTSFYQYKLGINVKYIYAEQHQLHDILLSFLNHEGESNFDKAFGQDAFKKLHQINFKI